MSRLWVVSGRSGLRATRPVSISRSRIKLLREQFGKRLLQLTDAQRIRLARKGRRSGSGDYGIRLAAESATIP